MVKRLCVISADSLVRMKNRADFVEKILFDVADSGKIDESNVMLNCCMDDVASEISLVLFLDAELAVDIKPTVGTCINGADVVVVLHDSSCEATLSHIKYARALGKPVHVYKYKV